MKVTIDKPRCQGHATCVIAAPDMFVLNDDGYNEMDPFEVQDGDEDKARRGAMMCPERAILITEDDAARLRKIAVSPDDR